jgi:hypothetical protein
MVLIAFLLRAMARLWSSVSLTISIGSCNDRAMRHHITLCLGMFDSDAYWCFVSLFIMARIPALLMG